MPEVTVMAESEGETDAVPTGTPRPWTHPRSGRDPALSLVAAELSRDLGLEALAKAVTVSWNSRMRTAAGRAFAREWRIELNPRLQDLPGEAREAELRNTFLHELAHLVAFARVGRKRIAPHGPEWRQACHDLGIPGEDRCHALDCVLVLRGRKGILAADGARSAPRAQTPLTKSTAGPTAAPS